jgi:hypothetical protein
MIRVSGKTFKDHCTLDSSEMESTGAADSHDGDTELDDFEVGRDDEDFGMAGDEEEEEEEVAETAAAAAKQSKSLPSQGNKIRRMMTRNTRWNGTTTNTRTPTTGKGATPASRAAIVIPPSPTPPPINAAPHPGDAYMKEAFNARLMNSAGGDSTSLSVVSLQRVFDMGHTGKYQPPHGRVGNQLAAALSRITDSVAFGRIRSDWIIIFEAVIFQRDPGVKGNKDIRALFQRRLGYWSRKEFGALLDDAERCSRQLRRSPSSPKDKDSTTEDPLAIASRLVRQHKPSAALRFLREEDTKGILEPDACANDTEYPEATVEEILRMKHPPMTMPPNEAFLPRPTDEDGKELPLPTMIDITCTADVVQSVAYRMQSRASSSGPGSLDSSAWCALLLHYGKDSEHLREAMARLVEHIANGILPWENIRGIMANRLVGLDKAPGVRPIGIGHFARRLIGKCMADLTKADIELVCGNEQLCAGTSNGTEAAIHAMSSRFIELCLGGDDALEDTEDDGRTATAVGGEQQQGRQQHDKQQQGRQRGRRRPAARSDGVEEEKGERRTADEDDEADEGWGFLKVDADNAFNNCSIIAALWHARLLWPRCARFLFNTHRGHTMLVMYKALGKPSILYRQDGTTQGDPLAMLLYGLATLPLIRRLRAHMEEGEREGMQAWYADDASALANFTVLDRWLTFLMEHGPAYGYYAKPVKSGLTVEHKHAAEAHRRFDHMGLKISAGTPYMGGFIGLPGSYDQQGYLQEKTESWIRAVDLLTEMAHKDPQAAYVLMTKCLYPQWEYLQRVTSFPNSTDSLFADLDAAIKDRFIPALFGGEGAAPILGREERELLELRNAAYGLPLRFGGLSLPPTAAYSRPRFDASRRATRHLQESLSDSTMVYSPLLHQEQAKEATKHLRAACLTGYQSIYKAVLGHEHMPPDLARAFERAREYRTHGFLTVQPAVGLNFDLSRNEFRDGLAIRYRTPVVDLPDTCDGCGEPMSLQHGLKCHKGGLPTRRHNEICDFLVGICQQAWGGICPREPIIRHARGEEGMLKGDFVVKGVWERELVTYFDTRVVDTDAATYLSSTVAAKLLQAEKEKVKKYTDACREIRASFTPFVISTDGALGPQASHFLRHLAGRLATKWQAPLSAALGWLRPRLSCAVVRACSYCLRGPRNTIARYATEPARVDFVSDGVALGAATSFVSS